MDILAVNCGSSTLKFVLFAFEDARGEKRIAHGLIDRVGDRAVLEIAYETGELHHQPVNAPDHAAAMRLALAAVKNAGQIDAVGHRVVHGGERFVTPTVIDDEVLGTIEALRDLAPLHNDPALSAIHASRTALGSSIPMVAVFDTAFHATLPERASNYAIPSELAARHRVRRYGFHGLAHRSMMERYAATTSTPLDRVRLVTLQLGNGCSATAIANGHSVDTSMGFTPLEGLMMGTRSGDIDPSLVGFLARREGADIADVEDMLNTRSGLLGVSGLSSDMRDLLEAERNGDPRAALAVEMFCYRVRKYVGAYLAVMGGADAVVFGGGIGENVPTVRERICAGMSWCGLTLDADRNASVIGTEARISRDDAAIQAYVIPVDEGSIIARDTARCLGSDLFDKGSKE